MVSNEVACGTVSTPLGTFGVVLTAQGLSRLTLPNEPLERCESWIRRWAPGATLLHDGRRLKDLKEQLAAYCEGQICELDVPIDLRGTAFQRQVWEAVRSIRYGEVRTYAQIAEAIGRPKAVRAVGAANGLNPVPIVVPCHRVIGSNGKLVGYAGGLDMKQRLLELEQAVRTAADALAPSR